MVLQVMFLAICEFGPERKHDDTWLQAITNGSTVWTASRLSRPWSWRQSTRRLSAQVC